MKTTSRKNSISGNWEINTIANYARRYLSFLLPTKDKYVDKNIQFSSPDMESMIIYTGTSVTYDNGKYYYPAKEGTFYIGKNVTNLSYTFMNDALIKNRYIPENHITDISKAYMNCYNIKGSPVCGNYVINMANTYYNCRNLTGSPVCGDKVTDMAYTYFECYNLTGSPVCGNNVINMCSTYVCCFNITGSPVCRPNVTNMYQTYYRCSNLTGNLYMYSNNVQNTINMLYDHNSQNILNIFVCPNTTTNSTLYSNRVGCGDWILDESNSCYYNARNNIYVYYNWNGK